MKTLSSATRITFACGLIALGISVTAPSATAGLFHRRTVVVESPTVYVAPVPTVYAAPVSTVVAAPTVYAAPVVDTLVAPTAYVPTVTSRVIAAPVTTTYVPTVTTVPSVLVPTTKVRVISPRRAFLLGY